MRTKLFVASLAGLTALALACSSGGTDDTDSQGSPEQTDAPATAETTDSTAEKTIVLEVTGPDNARVSWVIGGDQSQEANATLPWKEELTQEEPILTSVSAQIKSGSGEITCKITIDGEVVEEKTSQGDYAVVTCTGNSF